MRQLTFISICLMAFIAISSPNGRRLMMDGPDLGSFTQFNDMSEMMKPRLQYVWTPAICSRWEQNSMFSEAVCATAGPFITQRNGIEKPSTKNEPAEGNDLSWANAPLIELEHYERESGVIISPKSLKFCNHYGRDGKCEACRNGYVPILGKCYDCNSLYTFEKMLDDDTYGNQISNEDFHEGLYRKVKFEGKSERKLTGCRVHYFTAEAAGIPFPDTPFLSLDNMMELGENIMSVEENTLRSSLLVMAPQLFEIENHMMMLKSDSKNTHIIIPDNVEGVDNLEDGVWEYDISVDGGTFMNIKNMNKDVQKKILSTQLYCTLYWAATETCMKPKSGHYLEYNCAPGNPANRHSSCDGPFDVKVKHPVDNWKAKKGVDKGEKGCALYGPKFAKDQTRRCVACDYFYTMQLIKGGPEKSYEYSCTLA